MDLSFEIIQALKAIAREKDVDENLIIESLQAALVSAAKKKYGATSRIVAELEDDLGRLQVYCVKTVVDNVEDPQVQMSLEEAREIFPEAEVGQDVKIEVPPEHFGRNAIQAAKQVVIQRIREAERDRVFREYDKRIGDVVTGGVQQVDRGSIIVNLGKTEAILPQREQIPREQFRQGNSIKAYIVEVSKTSKGPQVVLSRSHCDFMRKLFTMEVPEIESGIVEIRAIAREPGSRSKIAVTSNDDKVDAVGACVGMKGSRVQSVVRELGGERIDVVLWNGDPVVFVTRALSPAKVVHAEMDEDGKKTTVVVADDQLSLAIGKGGQNARLAAKLTSLKIDLINESQYAERLEFQKMAKVPVTEIVGVDDDTKARLAAAGYATAQDVARAAAADLAMVEGLDEEKARSIIDDARATIADIRESARAAKQAAEGVPEAEEGSEEAEEAEEAEEPAEAPEAPENSTGAASGEVEP
jgi:N utilization substance protein A